MKHSRPHIGTLKFIDCLSLWFVFFHLYYSHTPVSIKASNSRLLDIIQRVETHEQSESEPVWIKHKNCFCAYMRGQRVVCLCVKNSWMKSLSVPCIAEQLAKLDQWQCHSVHTPPSSHTYQLCSALPHWHGHCHTPFPLSWKHTTQGQTWLILFPLTLQWIFPIVQCK